MNQQEKYVKTKMRLSNIFLAAGLVLLAAGIILQLSNSNLDFNVRIISGIGILLLGLGVAQRIKYAAASKDPMETRRIVNAERDERMVLIRSKAGNRAYFASGILTYLLLMWVSFASNGSLPKLSDDLMWYCLAAIVVLPVVVYIISIVVDEKNS